MPTQAHVDPREAHNEAMLNEALSRFVVKLAARQRTLSHGRVSLEAGLRDGYLVRVEVIDVHKERIKPRGAR